MAVAEALRTLGHNLRTARLRRNLSAAALAERIGVTRQVVADLERGKPTTAIAAYLGALWALGLLDGFHLVADPDHDEEGKALERAHGRERARTRTSLDNDF